MSVTTGPVMGELLPIELANATYAVRGRLQDGLSTVEQLTCWLEKVRPRLPGAPSVADLRDAGPEDLTMARELRDAIRTLATVAVGTDPVTPPATAARANLSAAAEAETLNRIVRAAPSWRELRWTTGPSAELRTAARPITAVLSGIAELAVDLFAGPALDDLRACHAPGCVLFFSKDHPRRAWCSAGCGNRARAARHYKKSTTAHSRD